MEKNFEDNNLETEQAPENLREEILVWIDKQRKTIGTSKDIRDVDLGYKQCLFDIEELLINNIFD